MKLKRYIIVTASVEGYHCWPDAPKEVNFLRHVHRHVFHIKAGMRVDHNNRKREFFIEQRKLQITADRFIGYNDEGSFSCEMFAEDILKQTPYLSWVEVWEDNENGARLERA